MLNFYFFHVRKQMAKQIKIGKKANPKVFSKTFKVNVIMPA
jgi:hypothetical protein